MTRDRRYVLIAGGLAGVALGLIAQTTLNLLVDDLGPRLPWAFRVWFVIADLATLIGLVSLRSVTPFFKGAAALVLLSMTSTATGLLEAGDAAITLGAALLMVLGVSPPLPSAGVVRWLVLVAFLLRAWRVLGGRSEHSINLAWVGWSLEVARFLVLAVVMFQAARIPASPPMPAAPYREAAPRPIRVGVVPWEEIPSVDKGVSGLGLYRLALFGRLIGMTLLSALFVLLLFVRDGGSSGAVLVLMPMLGAGTAILSVVGTAMAGRFYARGRARGLSVGACILFVLVALFDLFIVVIDVLAIGESTSHGGRTAIESLLIEIPFTTMLAAIAFYMLVVALERVAARTDDEAMIVRARSVRTAFIVATALTLSALLCAMNMSGRVSKPTEYALLAEALVAIVVMIGTGVLHVIFVSKIRGVMQDHIRNAIPYRDKPDSSDGPPGVPA